MGIIARRGWTGCAAWLLVAAGCYAPNPAYLGPAVGDDSSGSGSGESDESESGGDSGNFSGTDASTPAETTDETGTSDSEDTGSVNCADANAEPGELCFVANKLLALPVQSLAAGDFDSDGHLDLAVAAKNDIQVLFGNGSGGFPLQVDLPEADGDYFSASAGDLDQDGRTDLLVGNFTIDSVVVHASLGAGEFAAPVAFDAGHQPVATALALLDGDDRLDVVIANKGPDTVSVLINEGFGLLGPPASEPTQGDEPRYLVLGTFDAGPTLDIAVVNRVNETLSILLGDGEGNVGPAHVEPFSGQPNGLTAADFDLDGALDLAVALSNDTVEIRFGDGLGGFESKSVETSVGDKPIAVAVADLDIDGALDLVVLQVDAANVGVLFGDPAHPGEFFAQQTLVGLSNFSGLTTLLVADFNSDGVDDLIVGGSEVRTLISNP